MTHVPEPVVLPRSVARLELAERASRVLSDAAAEFSWDEQQWKVVAAMIACCATSDGWEWCEAVEIGAHDGRLTTDEVSRTLDDLSMTGHILRLPSPPVRYCPNVNEHLEQSP